MSRDPDVLVVGAGPAGASAALRLARRGVRVRILDAAAFPRSKPCGDCLSPGATPLLEELGVAAGLRADGAGALGGWAMRTPGGRWFTGTFGSEASGRGADAVGAGAGAAARGAPRRGLALPRAQLDARLADAAADAGAELREGVRAFALLRDDGTVRGVRARDGRGRAVEHRARVVVGADGLRSTVARRLGGVRRGPRRRLALVGRFADVAPPDADGQTPWPVNPPRAAGNGDPPGEMRLGRDGVLGLAPVGGGRWNTTLVVPRERAAEISADRRDFFHRGLRAYGVADRFAGAEALGDLEITGPFETSPRRTTAPGVLLAGDAAGYFDPLTGQGIHRALATGRSAAAAVLRLLRAGSEAARAAARADYESEVARVLGPGRRVQRLVDEVVQRPWLLGPVASLLARRPGLASLLVDVTGDRLPASSLADPGRLWRALAADAR